MNHNDPMHTENLPPDLADIAAALDALAASERAAVPVGLAARIHRSTLPELQRSAEEPVVYTFPTAHGSRTRGLAMAAALALLATVGAVWLSAQRPAGAGGTPARLASISETDVDAWLTLAGVTDSSGSSVVDPLDQIAADADVVAQSVSDNWMRDDLFNSDQSTEGSL